MPRFSLVLAAFVALLAFPLTTALHAASTSSPPAPKKTAAAPKPGDASVKKPADAAAVSRDDAVRLQIFLDHENFGPGKIDGQYGGFTKLAWQRWQSAHGKNPPSDQFDPKDPALAEVSEPFTDYTLTAEDLANVGPIPSTPPEQAKLKALTYASVSEELGERFHSGVEFLKKLNAPKNLDQLKEGDTVRVPNVQPPFNLATVTAVRDSQRSKNQDTEKAKKEKAAKDNKKPGATPEPAISPSPVAATVPAATPPPPAAEPVAILSPAAYAHISVKDCLLELRDGDRLVAAFPVTPGSKDIPSPVGEWKIESKTLLPIFRWDKEMLMHGRRSDDAHILPPGPNSPVGIAWIQLNKPGIGLHGTNSPDTIGRSASHGCIRLSNWDAFKVYGMVNKGLKVVIE